MYTVSITDGDVGTSITEYAFVAQVDSPRTLRVTADNMPYVIGSTATITATIQNLDVGLSGATVQAQFSRPGLVTNTVTLIDQGSGVYIGHYPIPNMPGYLSLSVVSQGNDGGTPYARQADSLIAISPSTVNLTGQYSDGVADMNGNDQIDNLDLAIGLNVAQGSVGNLLLGSSTTTGAYILSADLVGAGNVLVAHSIISTTLDPGIALVTISFDGDEIRRSGVSGPYTVTNIIVTDLQYEGVPAIWQANDVWMTAPYDPKNFASSCYVLANNSTPGGTVTASTDPNCNGSLQYTSDSMVTLTAHPDPDHVFAGWGGDVGGINAMSDSITVDLRSDKTVEAHFLRVNHRLYLPLVQRSNTPPAPTCPVFTSTDVPKPITDNLIAGVQSSLVIPGPGVNITDLSLRINDLRHTYVGDLQISLIAPNGTETLLVDRVGNNGDDFMGTRLNDDASIAIVDGTAPFTDNFKPDNPLSSFHDMRSAGIWRLRVADRAVRDTGTLNSWSLEVCGTP